jgi:hypothetical protein
MVEDTRPLRARLGVPLPGCTCEDNDCPNALAHDYHHENGGCLDCECSIAAPPTVKRCDLVGAVTDTHQTERELNGWADGLANGWKPSQGRLLDAPRAVDPRQGAFPL